MSSKDAGIRQDLIENGVEHELVSIQEDLGDPEDLESAVESEFEHNLLVWPREYLEPYLDSDSRGRVPLNEVQLQDMLEAAFERDVELSLNSRTEPSVARKQSDRREWIGSDTDSPQRPERNAGTATDKGLQHSVNEDHASLTKAISDFTASIRLAAIPPEEPCACRLAALSDTGIYSGRIVAETPELVIQRISTATEVAHLKEFFDEMPMVGQLLRIAYHDNVATVREIHERKIERGLLR
jgi:hypothetical protein